MPTDRKPGTQIVLGVLAAAALTLGGCSQQEQKPPGAQPSASRQIVEDMTGYTQVKTARKAEKQIKEVSAEHNKDLNEITP